MKPRRRGRHPARHAVEQAQPEQQRDWVINGSPNWNGNWNKQWYGVKRFFDVPGEQGLQDAHPRALVQVPQLHALRASCGGARLKTEALLWRVGSKALADAVLPPNQRFMPVGVDWSREQLEALPGLCLHDLMLLPIDKAAPASSIAETATAQTPCWTRR